MEILEDCAGSEGEVVLKRVLEPLGKSDSKADTSRMVLKTPKLQGPPVDEPAPALGALEHRQDATCNRKLD